MNLLVQFWELRRLDGDVWEVRGVTYAPEHGTREFRATVAEVHPAQSAITATDGERYPLARSVEGIRALTYVSTELEAV